MGTINPFAYEILMLLIRWGLTALGAVLIGKGIATEDQVQQGTAYIMRPEVIGGVITALIGLYAGFRKTKGARIKMLGALAMGAPKGQEPTEAQLDARLADPLIENPPANKAVNAQPYFKLKEQNNVS